MLLLILLWRMANANAFHFQARIPADRFVRGMVWAVQAAGSTTGVNPF